MPSQVMDQGGTPLYGPSSIFSDEIHFPVERQVGFLKSGSLPDHVGLEGMSLMLANNTAAASRLSKNRPIGVPSVESLHHLSKSHIVKDQNDKLSLEQRFVGAERTSSLSMTSWKVTDHCLGLQPNLFVQPASSPFMVVNKVELNGPQHDNSLFSSSLSETFHKKLTLSSTNVLVSQSIDTVIPQFEEDGPFESLKEIEAQTIGNLLPDDDDLLSGVNDDLGFYGQPNAGDDMEDFDLFSSVGGMELEADDGVSCYGGNKSLDLSGGNLNGQQGGPNSPFAGEHPYGEHPSRTLFVRNINSNVEDSELRVLFEQYGDIRTLYTACKHRGFVMISYYDIRAARNAMRALQNKPLRRRKLDIHFSIPKDNPSEKDINQGTLVVFNLDSSVSNDDLRQIFGVYGEIKEIHETPHKRHHKFIEFYDVRAAEAALCALNRCDIAGKRIKLEPSRPGGARRCSMQQLSPELEQEDANGFQDQGSPSDNSTLECFGSVPSGAVASNSLYNGAIQVPHSAIRSPISPFAETAFHGISSSLPHGLASPVRVASLGNYSNQSGVSGSSRSLSDMKFGFQCIPSSHPHSLPEYHHGTVTNGASYNSPGSMSAMAASMNSRPAEAMDNMHIQRIGSGGLNSHSFELNEGGNKSCPLHGHQYIWNNNSFHSHHPSSMMWPNSPSFVNGIHAHHPHQMHDLPRAPSLTMNALSPLHQHHVGSTPAVNPSLWDRRHAYAGHSADASSFHPGSLGSIGFSAGSILHPLELASRNIFPHVGANPSMSSPHGGIPSPSMSSPHGGIPSPSMSSPHGGILSPSMSSLHGGIPSPSMSSLHGGIPSPSMSSLHGGIPSPQQRCHMFPGRNLMIPLPSPLDSPNERVRSRRSEANSNQADNKKQYELDVDRILRGEDTRTTLMIKNIPNKYTSKMLLAAIDERHKGTYDFIYLPIDFKNKCNVGYAFINMTDPMRIIPFFQAFNGKKWEKFNSEKVASLAYARIQGKGALIAHFQNSSLMNEDKRCRPILFHSDGPNAGDQEPFPMGVNIRSRAGKTRTSHEDNHQGSPSNSANGEDGTDSSSGSGKDSE